MAFYLVGMVLQSATHDYTPLADALLDIEAQRISSVAWLFDVDQSEADLTEAIRECLSDDDDVMVVELPEDRWWAARSEATRRLEGQLAAA